MLIAAFIALTILVAAVLITRHYYLKKIEKLEAAHADTNYLDFRRGYDKGWEDGFSYGRQRSSYDRVMEAQK